MLQIHAADMLDDLPVPAPAYAAPARLLPPLPERSVYRPSRRQDAVSGIASFATVALLISGFAWIREPPVHHVATSLTVLDLRAVPPPPPRPVPRQPQRIVPHQDVPIVSPRPVVTAPAPSPVVAVSSPAPIAPVVPVPAAPPAATVAPAAPAPAAVAPVDGGDLSSRMLSAKPPSYPLDSRRKNEEGTVVLTVLLDSDGRVADIAVAQSSGFDRLDHAALTAVRAWRWAPLIKGGIAVAVEGRVKIPFVLKH